VSDARNELQEALNILSGYINNSAPLPPCDNPYWKADKALDILRAAILRESFPEPAPAEQGEDVRYALNVRIPQIRRVLNNSYGLTTNIRDGECVKSALIDLGEIEALLASRPQPEAKVVPMAAFADILTVPSVIRAVLAVVGYQVKE
jgi:hypothetical protein